MVYDFHTRLARNGVRFKELSSELISVSRPDGATVSDIVANPILMKADELTPETGSIVRLEWQDFAVDVIDLGALHPPVVGDKITRNGGERFVVMSQVDDRPPWRYTSSQRTRIIFSTKRDTA